VKNIYEVLRQKEMDCDRLQNEIEALRLAIPLLVEKQPEPGAQGQEDKSFLTRESTGTDGPTPSSVGHTESSFWKRRRETHKLPHQPESSALSLLRCGALSRYGLSTLILME
jgi:hypothetical protein